MHAPGLINGNYTCTRNGGGSGGSASPHYSMWTTATARLGYMHVQVHVDTHALGIIVDS